MQVLDKFKARFLSKFELEVVQVRDTKMEARYKLCGETKFRVVIFQPLFACYAARYLPSGCQIKMFSKQINVKLGN